MRRLVICADGTWNSSDNESKRTNVVLLHEAVSPIAKDGVEQRAFYQVGVGVTGGAIGKLTGGAFGTGLNDNILACYRFLIHNFDPGDDLFLFGFSRGAYTVRSLAGLVRNSGILKREHSHKADAAFDLYRDRGDDTHPSSPQAEAFRAARSHETRIKFIGVWDTVGSLGVPTRGPIGMISRQRHGFHDVQLSSWVDNAFHALSIDERRKPFAPALWEVPDDDVQQGMHGRRVEQRWFAGVHSNVGGGYPDRGLSDITLRWMAERAAEAGLELGGSLTSIKGKASAKLINSMKPVFKVLGQHVRPVGVPRKDPKKDRPVHTFESVDRTVCERHADLRLGPLYDPANCVEYWNRNPDQWDPRRATRNPPVPAV